MKNGRLRGVDGYWLVFEVEFGCVECDGWIFCVEFLLFVLFFFVFFVVNVFVDIFDIFVFIWFWWMEMMDFGGDLINFLFVGICNFDFGWFVIGNCDVSWWGVDDVV